MGGEFSGHRTMSVLCKYITIPCLSRSTTRQDHSNYDQAAGDAKSAVRGFHADNDIDTMNLLAERRRVDYGV